MALHKDSSRSSSMKCVSYRQKVVVNIRIASAQLMLFSRDMIWTQMIAKLNWRYYWNEQRSKDLQLTDFKRVEHSANLTGDEEISWRSSGKLDARRYLTASTISSRLSLDKLKVVGAISDWRKKANISRFFTCRCTNIHDHVSRIRSVRCKLLLIFEPINYHYCSDARSLRLRKIEIL